MSVIVLLVLVYNLPLRCRLRARLYNVLCRHTLARHKRRVEWRLPQRPAAGSTCELQLIKMTPHCPRMWQRVICRTRLWNRGQMFSRSTLRTGESAQQDKTDAAAACPRVHVPLRAFIRQGRDA